MKDILTGHLNNLTGKNKHLSEHRMSICNSCNIINDKQYCDKKKGGCGCYLPAKTKVAHATCPLKKW